MNNNNDKQKFSFSHFNERETKSEIARVFLIHLIFVCEQIELCSLFFVPTPSPLRWLRQTTDFKFLILLHEKKKVLYFITTYLAFAFAP